MRLPRDIEPVFAAEYLKDFDVVQAAERCGIVRSARYFGNALLKRKRVQSIVAADLKARNFRLQIEADFVLAALIQQLARLTGMLGHDLGDLYFPNGGIRPISEWPEIWRRKLITGIDVEDTYKRSEDGVQAGESKAWDRSGQVTKIKRESELKIEKEIRETLELIGRHVNVKAWENPLDSVGKGMTALAHSIDSAIADGRKRAAGLLKATIDGSEKI